MLLTNSILKGYNVTIMFKKLNSIYTQNKILGVILYFLAFTVAFYGIFFVAGYYLITLIWKLKMPNWTKVAILIVPVFFLGIVGTAWTGVVTGVNKVDPVKDAKQTLGILGSSSSSSNSSEALINKNVSVSSLSSSVLSQVSSQIQVVSSQPYIKLEEGKAFDSDGSKVEVVNEIKEVEKAINTVPQGEYVKVLKVVDGDTIKVEKYGTIRLIGIDTPETKDPRKVVQCFGKEASQNAHNKLDGQKVKLEFNPADRIDKYNRVLAYVITEAGYDYNYNAIKDGFANAYIKFPHSRMESYLAAQKEARENARGLWSADTCNGDTTQPSKDNTKTNVQIPPTAPLLLPAPKVEAPKAEIVETPKTIDLEKSAIIKTSSSGICHKRGTAGYNSTKTWTNYNSIEECLADKGKLPK